jgi:hypothetical protein
MLGPQRYGNPNKRDAAKKDVAKHLIYIGVCFVKDTIPIEKNKNMIVKYYNSWTSHEAYFEFPKGTKKSKRAEHFKKWLLKDADIPPVSEYYDIQEYKEDMDSLFESGEMTIIKPQKIK